MAGLGGDGIGQAVAVGIGARRGGVGGRVLGRGQRHTGAGRGVVDRADRDGHGRAGRVDRAVVGLVGEAVGTVVVGRGHVVQLAGHDRGRAMAGLGGDGIGQGVAVGIGARGGGVGGRVLGRGQRHTGAGRGGVARGHGQADRDRVRVGRAVVGLVGEAVGPDVVGRGHVAERAIGVEGDRAVRGISDLERGQDVAVGIGVVAEDARGGHDLGRVLGRAVAVRPPRPGRR